MSRVENSPPARANSLLVWLSWSLCIAYMGVIYRLSSMSSVPVPAFFIEHDFLSHALLYAVLSGLLSWALLNSGAGNRSYLYAVLIGTVYGVGDELHQAFVPGRHASVVDVMADGSGAVLGACIVYGFRRLVRNTAGKTGICLFQRWPVRSSKGEIVDYE